MGKFALRDLAQSLARELSPQSTHLTHFVIDGRIRGVKRTEPADKLDSMLDPMRLRLLLECLWQPRSALAGEMGLRPWTRIF
jgi:hypothetical protein